MVIVGFNFKKISVEKNDSMRGKISIKNNISIKDVTKHFLEFGDKKKDAIKFSFDFVTMYDVDNKNLAKINLEGDVISIEKADITKHVLEKWKKDKKLDDAIMILILNTALVKCNIQALILSKEMNLPSPIPLPKLNVPKKSK